MQVLVKAKDSFVHGDLSLGKGELAMMDEHLARELVNLVDIQAVKMASPHLNKMMPAPLNKGKVQAAGTDAPSPSSPAAQASPKATVKPSEHGVRRGKIAA